MGIEIRYPVFLSGGDVLKKIKCILGLIIGLTAGIILFNLLEFEIQITFSANTLRSLILFSSPIIIPTIAGAYFGYKKGIIASIFFSVITCIIYVVLLFAIVFCIIKDYKSSLAIILYAAIFCMIIFLPLYSIISVFINED